MEPPFLPSTAALECVCPLASARSIFVLGPSEPPCPPMLQCFLPSFHGPPTSQFILITVCWESKESHCRPVLDRCLSDRTGVQVLIVLAAHGIQSGSILLKKVHKGLHSSHQSTSKANDSSIRSTSTEYLPNARHCHRHLGFICEQAERKKISALGALPFFFIFEGNEVVGREQRQTINVMS